jgi:hypothetical protein
MGLVFLERGVSGEVMTHEGSGNGNGNGTANAWHLRCQEGRRGLGSSYGAVFNWRDHVSV